MSFLKAIFDKMPSIRKRKVQSDENKKSNGSKRLKSGKIQKYSSSSESELDDDTPKNKISPKKQTIQKKGLTKKHLKRTKASSTPESSSVGEIVKADEGTEQLKGNSSENLGTNHSSDSDERPLVIDEDSDNDLKGLQNFMTENYKPCNSSPSKSKHDNPVVKFNLENKSPQKNDASPSKSKHGSPVVKFNLENKSPQKNDLSPSKSKHGSPVVKFNLKSKSPQKYAENLKNYEAEVNRRKKSDKDIKIDVSANEKSTTAAHDSESNLNEKQEIDVSTENLKKDAKSRGKPVEKNSRSSSSQSESDQEEKHKTINTSNEDENMKVDVKKESNANNVETEIDDEIAKDLINTCPLPIVNYDLEMLNELKEKKYSDSSDFELTLGTGSSQEESSDTGKKKSSKRDLQKRSRVFRKKTVRSPRKIPTPPPEVKQEPDVSSDDSAEEEDLNEMGVSLNYTTYKPSEEERQKLANMMIKLRYLVPPQHQIESTAGTRTMTENEKEEFEKIVPLKHGYFSPEEDKQIKKNWKIFCRDNNWDPKKPQPFLFMKHKNKVFLLNRHSRRKFMRGLAHGLPNRCLYSVFQRFKILFEPHRTCRYESDEDRRILDYVAAYEQKRIESRKSDVNEKDRKFAELAIMLRRTRASVWRRYRVLQKKAGQEAKDAFCHSNK